MEIEVNGSNYRTGKLDAFKQLHVSRKIAPVMTKLLPAMLAGASLTDKADGSDVSPEELASMMGSIQPLAQALSEMSEADCDFVCHTCLGTVSIQQGNTWMPVWNSNAKALMFESIDLSTMLQLVATVVKDQLMPFFSGLLANTPQGS